MRELHDLSLFHPPRLHRASNVMDFAAPQLFHVKPCPLYGERRQMGIRPQESSYRESSRRCAKRMHLT